MKLAKNAENKIANKMFATLKSSENESDLFSALVFWLFLFCGKTRDSSHNEFVQIHW